MKSRRKWSLLVLACLLVWTTACSTTTLKGKDAAAGDANGGIGGIREVGTNALDAVGLQEGNEYWDGPYRCCEQSLGTDCCASEKTGFCYKYGGIYGACRREGEEYEGKITCAHCCAGLTAVSASDIVSSDGGRELCSDPPPSVLRCVYCGDGTCGIGESRCNCPQDCG